MCIQSYLFLLSSDYERSEWKESIQKLQKKGNTDIIIAFLTFYILKNVCLEMCETFFCVWFFPDLQSCVLSSVELQVLTSSCFKLRTVHNIPVTSNKDGKELRSNFALLCLVDLCFF